MYLIVLAIHNWYLGTFLQVRNLYIVFFLRGGGQIRPCNGKIVKYNQGIFSPICSGLMQVKLEYKELN